MSKAERNPEVRKEMPQRKQGARRIRGSFLYAFFAFSCGESNAFRISDFGLLSDFGFRVSAHSLIMGLVAG
jgi:hypothetical protein